MSHHKILLSVIMSVYNGGTRLKLTLESLARQQFSDYEFIIVDDGSTDDTSQTLKKYSANDVRIKVITHPNIGLTRSLDVAIRESSGKYIARQDACDISNPNRLLSQIEFMYKHPKIGLLGTAFRIVDDQNCVLHTVVNHIGPEKISESILQSNCFCHGSVMFQRELYFSVGGYRAEFDATQDYDLWLRMSEVAKTANLPEPLYDYHFNMNSITFRKALRQFRLSQFARQLAAARSEGLTETDILKERNSFLERPVLQEEVMRLLRDYTFWVRVLLNNGRKNDAFKVVDELIRISPSSSLLFKLWLARIIGSSRVLLQIIR